jgi:hypothetical protein
MIKTDGVSVSICLGPQTTKGSSGAKKRKRDADAKEAKAAEAGVYFDGEDIDLTQYHSNRVYIDPNKRDLLYCLGSADTKDNPQVCLNP